MRIKRKEEPNFFGPGVETEEDEKRLLTQLDFIRRHLQSVTGWHTLQSIADAYEDYSGKPALLTSVSAGLRALRREKHGGYNIQRKRLAGGLYGYRLLAPAETTEKRKLRIL